MTARRIPVAVEGGWSTDGTMRITISDPYNRNTLIEVAIPERTFVNMLRNFHAYQPPLGEATLHPASLDQYGTERQNANIKVPDWNAALGGCRPAFTGWAAQHVPDGWTLGESGWNSHRSNGGRYSLHVYRYVEPGTPAEVEGHPGVAVHSTYNTPESWGQA